MQPRQEHLRRTDDFVKPVEQFLTHEEETDLFAELQFHIDRESHKRRERTLSRIIKQYTPIVLKQVRRMSGYGMDPEELRAEALEALVQAALRFDPEKGFRFATYAQSCIRGVLLSHITKNYFITNVCTTAPTKKLFFMLRKMINRHAQETGEFILTDELVQSVVEKTGAAPEDIIRMKDLLSVPYSSLDGTVRDDDGKEAVTEKDRLVSHYDGPEDIVMDVDGHAFRKRILADAINTLSERERIILQEQRLTENPKTLEELRVRFGISRERVRQIRQAAIKRVGYYVKTALREEGMVAQDIL